ncbi:translocation/assembly module TamB domain-containing protein [Mucilaginibacter sp. Bleaf8]|uniref:translocation/assembly module TamB domain-containing protein n=1 Tax=Mucilaginibacter sp. Bleaf8 TaxID=2834430 RepID=UPI001BCD0A7A|nr:translocation/assembly module TamB domain-containing protein [Mucilaginibacter sp. Bleaf8]MBS7564248.1 translocation/assembly module TamB domain-containing protein [Mucilaginibacter sp. Bleaf8]
MMSIVLLLFQFKPVQTWAAKKATGYLSNELHTKVDIKSLYIKPFSSVVLEDLYVLDKQKDTLLHTPRLTVELNRFSPFNSIKKRELNFNLIQLDNGSFYLKKLKDSTTNLQFIIDYFSGKPDTAKKVSKPWTINFGKVALNNFHFRYKNNLSRLATPRQVNFDDIDVTRLSLGLTQVDLKNHLFKGHLQNLTLHEKSGFDVRNLTVNATIDTTQILLQNLLLQTPHSLVKDYFRMRFKSFDDFSDFENRVRMDADIKTSHLSSKDVAYFTSSLDKSSFEFGLNGRARGLVNNIKARNLMVTTGQATYLKGDFNLKGLPDWEKTYLDLSFEQLASNKKDLDNILSKLVGSKMILPAFLNKFGNINFTGKLTGYQNSFTTTGTFKTKLGRLDPDLNLKFDAKNVPAYSGMVTATNFDLASLMGDNTLGRTTFKANVKGRGDELKNLNADIQAQISYIAFKGYTYHNLTANGSFQNQVANGRVTINDRNLKLNLAGNINLKPRLPQYTFNGSITDAHINRLRLLKDTITLTTIINTSFSGDALDNMQGHVTLSPTRITTPSQNYVLDSVSLSASGSGNNRLINLKSDLADGSIKGTFDLATLPSYFKTIAKKYIPSLKTQIVRPKPENFEFNLRLKNMDPVLAMFAPNVKLPDQGSFVGRFNSADRTATLNGGIKTIRVGKMVFHDFIVDESTADSVLNVNLSLSRVDLTDSLYIKDINVSNFLKNDSLNFNVKLSDKNARNQLDLYGLVEFGRDTTAKLKLLPSEVVLESESWRLQEQVRIRLLDGKTQISGFELSNGEQHVRIDGFVSANPEDKLKLEFEKFSMATFNQLTKAAGVHLQGHLNGAINLSAVTKAPGIDANLRIDSLLMNQTLVGDVKIESSLDNKRKQADVKLNILNRGLETMNIAGAYYLDRENDNLDFNIRMDQTEAIIFEPFVKGLVSDVKGTISSDVKLTGSPSNPQLNGNITLANTGITVDYLKVPYTLNDRLTVENGLIKITNMALKDPNGGQGIVNGTVDLKDIANPQLDIKVQAKHLMALNTKYKDNHLYYGTAFASGQISFTGPIDNMNIDIKANTEDGTVFNIPLNTAATASKYEFIRFVNHRDSTKIFKNESAFKGVTLNFDLSADEKTMVRITTDLGLLEGRGQAKNLSLKINSLGDFDMYGDFLITSGKFELTAQNFISKNFQINQGGTIRWTGNPSNAEINLKATYELRANVADLYRAAGQEGNFSRQELVQAQLNITRTLLQPLIDFDFNFPVNPSIKDDVSAYLADVNNRNQQAISLIVRRQFATGNGTNINQQVVGTAKNAASEFFFNKLNSYIAQSNLKGLDINIRSEYDASASLHLFNDRFVVNGSLYSARNSSDLFNIGSGNLFNSSFNNLTRDFSAEYLIRPDGQLRGRYSYRALSTNTLTTTSSTLNPTYVNGIGLIYQRDFDSFREFWRNLFRKGRQRNTTSQPANTEISGPPATDDRDDNEDE